MRIAALDLGSNTFLCLIADIDHQGHITVIKDLVEVVRLGQGVAQSGRFSEESLTRAQTCLQRFTKEIQQQKPDYITGVATAAARSVSNGEALLKICDEAKIPMEIISGDREAELTFAGAISGKNQKSSSVSHSPSSHTIANSPQTPLHSHPYLVIDIGGGSTEIILGTSQELLFKKSFNIGVVKLKEKHVSLFPISLEIQKLLQNEIDQTFLEIKNGIKTEPTSSPSAETKNISFDKNFNIIAVAGTPTTLAAAVIGKFDPNKINGFVFSRDQLLEWKNRLSALTPEAIEEKFQVPKGRSDVLAVGVMILLGAIEALNAHQLQVSTRGLRFGLLLDHWHKHSRLNL